MMDFEVVNDMNISPTVIKIIGCGGGGSSAVARMKATGVSNVRFVILNTDLQALNKSNVDTKLAIGQKLTGGLGAGGNPEIGENAAKEDIDAITNIVKGSDMVIITAGMGGGTGTGSAPVVAQISRELDILTVAVVTTPFDFEGPIRMRYALEGIKKLREQVDSLIIIPNEKLMDTLDGERPFSESFAMADEVLSNGVQGLSDIITKTGSVNLDFADVKTVMKGQGNAILGVGRASGENRAVDAASRAIHNPLLEDRQIDGAKNILVNISSSGDIGTKEIQDITNTIRASANKEHLLFFGNVTNKELGDEVSVTVIATGFDESQVQNPQTAAKESVDVYEESTKNSEEASSVYSSERFNNLLTGGKTKTADKKAFSKPEVRKSAESDGKKSEIQFPHYNESDLSVPAVLRRREKLSKTINFTGQGE